MVVKSEKANPTPTKAITSKAYSCHGLDLNEAGDQLKGDCPFCYKENKFFVDPNTGKWDCKSCKLLGNIYTFLRSLHAESLKKTTLKDYQELAHQRKILQYDTLKIWQCAKSSISGDWLIPGFGVKGELNQLYRYVTVTKEGKQSKALYCTDGVGHALHGVNLFNKARGEVYICEGPWDAMALWEVMKYSVKRKSDGKILPQIPQKLPNNLSNANILAVPGAGVFLPSWATLCAGKRVHLLYDSDHLKINKVTQQVIPNSGSGLAGMKRAYSILIGEGSSAPTSLPQECRYINWGEKGYDPALADGYDVRDFLSQKTSMMGRAELLNELMAKVVQVPGDWKGREAAQRKIGMKSCTTWVDLEMAWRKAMKWTPGLKHGLTVSLAVVMSTPITGDQIWIKMIGPPSCGKTVLCEAISVNDKYIVPKSTIRGFHSGFRTKDGKDHSLISKIKGKTLITKDGDTLLTTPDKDRVLAEARDIYDTSSRSDYRHDGGQNHEGVRTTWILAGTEALIQLDKSELGQRFLSVIIMDKIDEELEDEIGWRKINQVSNNRAEANGRLESHHTPEMAEAMMLTGGYVSYLREHGIDLYSEVEFPDPAKRLCVHLGKFVSFMRARPSVKQDEVDSREMSTRLISQHGKLALCLAGVLNKKTIDQEVLHQLTRVAFDTARGKSLDVLRYLIKWAEDGQDAKVITTRIFADEAKGMTHLKFLRRLGVLEIYTKHIQTSVKGTQRWRLTSKMRELYGLVMEHYKEEL